MSGGRLDPTSRFNRLRARHRKGEARMVRAALINSRWRLQPAANELGLGVGSLQRMIVKYGLADEREEKREDKP